MNRDFATLPPIEIRSAAEINGANGAFSQDTGKIYLAAEFISQNANNLKAITNVLLEEYGHYVDSQINTADAPGDEGAIFSRLVQGEILSEQELAVLRAEDDTATVTLDGQVVEIEQNTFYAGFKDFYGTNGNDTIYSGNSDYVGYGNSHFSWSTTMLEKDLYNPKVYGGNGNDIIRDSFWRDNLYGGQGNDILTTRRGSDLVYGGEGDDLLYASAYIDGSTKKIWGGTGSDTFILDARGEIKTTLNFNVEQLIEFNNALSSTNTKWGRVLKDTVFLGLGAAFPKAEGFFYLANIAADEGFDQLDGLKQEENARRLLQQYPSDSWGEVLTSGTRDTILIEDFEIGVDTIVLPNLENLPGYTYGVSNLENKAGSSGVYVRIEGLNSQREYKQENIAFIKAPTNYSTNNNNNLSFGELILQLIDSKAGIISVFNKSPIEGDISSQPDINGTSAYDIINGRGGNDHIEGKAGNDIINGGDASDELWGGEGSDVFVYDSFSYSGTDTIKDFNTQQGDKILISNSAFTGVIDKTKFSYNTTTNTLSFNGKNLAVLNANSGFNLQRDLIIEGAEIFEHGNYQGKSLTLEPGKYDVNDLTNNGFGDNTLSSLKLPNGWSMRLYHNSDFTGANKVYTSDTAFTGDYWNFNDTVSSVVVSDGYAEVFEHGTYGGQSFKLAPGEYDFNHFSNYSFRPQSISSLIIPDNWKITLYSSPYENTSRTIYQKVFNSSASWVGNDWNDRAYSLKVEAPQPVPALALTNGTSTGTTGTSGNDNLVGTSGNDTLLGLGGQDTLTGGLGADKFRFNSPSERMDTITDFSRTQGDKIELFAP
ncbi:beta/gamma crystallin-related protein, partial [Nodularia spumigena CS-591/04]